MTWCSLALSHHSLPPNFSLLAAARSSHCCHLRLASSVPNNTQDTAHSAARVCTACIKPVLGGGPLWFLTTSSMEVKRPLSLSWLEVLFGSFTANQLAVKRPKSLAWVGAPCLVLRHVISGVPHAWISSWVPPHQLAAKRPHQGSPNICEGFAPLPASQTCFSKPAQDKFGLFGFLPLWVSGFSGTASGPLSPLF